MPRINPFLKYLQILWMKKTLPCHALCVTGRDFICKNKQSSITTGILPEAMAIFESDKRANWSETR